MPQNSNFLFLQDAYFKRYGGQGVFFPAKNFQNYFFLFQDKKSLSKIYIIPWRIFQNLTGPLKSLCSLFSFLQHPCLYTLCNITLISHYCSFVLSCNLEVFLFLLILSMDWSVLQVPTFYWFLLANVPPPQCNGNQSKLG